MRAVAHLQLLGSVCAQRAAIQCRMFASVQMAAAVPVDASRNSELVTKTSSDPSMQDVQSVAAKTFNGIKVSKDKDASDLAAVIAHSTRKGVNLNLLCLGAAATKVAVKSIVIGRSMLKDKGGLDVAFRPELRDEEADISITASYKLRLTLSSAQGSLMPSTPADQILMVSAKSKSAMLAGAMAHRIREGRPVALRGMGAGAVGKAILAACKTRTYLESEKKDIRLVPEYVKVTSEKYGETTACVMHVLVEDKQGQGQELIETLKESEAPLPQQAQPEQSQQAPEEPKQAPEEPKQAPEGPKQAPEEPKQAP